METKAKISHNETNDVDRIDDSADLHSGAVKYSTAVQSGADFIYKPGVVFLGFCTGNKIQHHQLYRIPLDRSGRTSGIFRFQRRSGKVAGPTGGYLVGFVFLTVIAGFLWSILKENCHLPFLEWYLERSYVIFSVQSGFLCS